MICISKKAGLVFIALITVTFFIGGCTTTGKKEQEWKPAASVNKQPFVHTVKYPGETLRIISQWYTGEANNWELLADANPGIDCDKLVMGSKIFIPETMLKNAAPLAADYIDSYNKKPKPKVEKVKKAKKEKKKPVVKKTKPSPKKDDDFDLIGPK